MLDYIIEQVDSIPSAFVAVCPKTWHESLYPGQCGSFKCEQNDVFRSPSPCAKIQDISCMTPDQLRVWSSVCKAKFL